MATQVYFDNFILHNVKLTVTRYCKGSQSGYMLKAKVYVSASRKLVKTNFRMAKRIT